MGTWQCDCYPREAVVTERRGGQPGASRRELKNEKPLETLSTAPVVPT